MITFNDYLKKFKRKFVCLSFTDETIKSLQAYCVENGFDLSTSYSGEKQNAKDFEFHTTIFYSDTFHNISNDKIALTPFEVRAESIELFGPKKNIPVLKLKLNQDIMKIRELFDQQGLKDSWPEYKPHVSLSYGFSGKINNTPLPTFPLVVNSFKIKDGGK